MRLTAASRKVVLSFGSKRKNQRKLPLFRRSGPATKGLHAPWIPKAEVAEGAGYANAVLLFALNARALCSDLKFGCCGVASAGPQLSAAKLGSEQCLPLRGKQPHERVCVANWRRSLCAAKRPRTPAGVNDCCFRDDLHFTSLPCRGRACPARSLAITAHLSFAS